jgi:hypothetical protein
MPRRLTLTERKQKEKDEKKRAKAWLSGKRKPGQRKPFSLRKAAKRPLKVRSVKKRRAINPAPLLYILTAKGTGKKMHFDGTKFSERARVKLFPTVEAAQRAGIDLVKKYPVLRKYRVAVESSAARRNSPKR